MKNTIVIYHDKCLDGLGAAYCAYKVFGDSAEYIPGKYDNLPDLEIFKNKHVYLLDFSFKRDYYLDLVKIAKSVTVIDHHKTANDEIGDLVKIDQTRSGAMLAMNFFDLDFSEYQKDIIRHIQDRDLWNFKISKTKEIAFALFEGINLNVEDFVKFIDSSTYLGLLERGTELVKKFDEELKEYINKAEVQEFKGYKVPVVQAPPKFASELGNILSKDFPFAVVWHSKVERIQNPQNLQENTHLELSQNIERVFYSLRSSKDGLDVSKIAEQFGGGGHKHAAGFFEDFDC